MTYVRHCIQPSLPGLLTQLGHAPALTCRAIFTRPSTTPAHEARAGDPGSPPQRTKRAQGTPVPGLCPIVPFTLCRTLRGSPSYCSPTPTSRSGLGSVAPSALCAMPTWALSCIWGTESVVLGRSLPTGLTIILFSCPDLTFGVSLRSGRVKTLPYRRVAPSSTPAHEARAGGPGYGALLNRSLHLVSHPTGLAIFFTYPDLTVGARLCRAFGALCDADMGTVVYSTQQSAISNQQKQNPRSRPDTYHGGAETR
jgi:hypothetical protein